MIVYVHQPEYLPWLGFFDKLSRCEVYVIYDDAQYQHGGFHNRNRIRTPQGWEWLTVPIKHGHPQIIKNVKIAGDQWKNKHLSSIKRHYQKTPYFQKYYPPIEDAITSDHSMLIDLNLQLIKVFAEILGINVKMVRSSEFPYGGTEKNEKLVSMCKFLGADTYLSGSGGRNYVKEEIFTQAKINLQWHNYEHPTYKQCFEGFEPNMSIIDLLFNEGPNAKKILQTGVKIEIKEAKAALEYAAPLIIDQAG
ncbi:MAG: WbqC family protein [Methanocella sp.]|jgi:hypothetical protein